MTDDGKQPKKGKPGRGTQRDDFNKTTRDALARRVALRCSNPDCRKPTSGPRKNPAKAVDVGVAAHICAAASGGPRYDPSMTPEQRSSIANAIWLCQTCAKLIDNDEQRYRAGLLEQWKSLAESTALLEVQSSGVAEPEPPDVELLRFFTQCLDRPAFQDPFNVEGSMEAFAQAIEDTIVALNTGCLRDRRGSVVARGRGKAYLKRHEWRREMDTIVDLLRAIRSRYQHAVNTGEIHVHALDDGQEFYAINDREVAHWMDATRAQILQLFSRLCEQAGLPSLRFPRRPWGPW